MKRIGYIDGRRVAGWSFPANASPGNGLVLNVVDPSTIASGYARAIYINYTNSGAKTGTAELNPLTIDVDSSADVPHIFPISIYIGALTGAEVNHAAGIYMYLDSTAGTLEQKHGIWLQMVATGATYADFLSVHNMGGTPRSIINSQSVGVCATNLIRMGAAWDGGASDPFKQGDLKDNAGANINCDGYFVCDIGGTPIYIPAYDTKA